MSHYVERCRQCDATVGGCRCMRKGKEVRYVDACAQCARRPPIPFEQAEQRARIRREGLEPFVNEYGNAVWFCGMAQCDCVRVVPEQLRKQNQSDWPQSACGGCGKYRWRPSGSNKRRAAKTRSARGTQ